ncbi:hypothetical protein [Spirillospora sp. NPDC047279]|uniref:hypothetical protein n=1 Tax=Spirillospora sp. NPDC047279 TaxID=3155478 RepID=UPI0033FDAEDE
MSINRTLTPAFALPIALVFTMTVACDAGGDDGAGSVRPGTSAPSGTAPAATPTPAATPNGVEKLSAAKILSAARKATAAAASLQIKGKVKDGPHSVALDLRYAGEKRATGALTMDETRLELTRIGDTVYIKGDDAFLRSIGGKGAVQLLSGKFFRTTSKDPDFRELAEFSDVSTLLRPEGTVRKGTTTTIDGRGAIALGDREGRLYVATEGEPIVLRIDAGEAGRVDFAYDVPVDVKAPPSGQVVDVSALKKMIEGGPA